jgi:hypothetical protein
VIRRPSSDRVARTGFEASRTHGDDHIVRLVLSKRGQVSKHAGTAQVPSAGGADAERRRCCCGRFGGESVEEHDVSASAIQSNCLVTVPCVCLPTCKLFK